MEENFIILNKNLFKDKPKVFLSRDQKINIKKFKEKISLEEYKFEQIGCEYCKKKNSVIISKYDRYGFPYSSNLCKSCGLIYTSPRLQQKSYNKFYDDLYRKIYCDAFSKNTDEEFFKSQILNGRDIYDFISQNSNINEISTILEVGCGMGGILVPFKEKNIKTLGIDYGSEFVEFGRSKNLNLQIGGIEKIKDQTFDCIIYSHVFEHILDLEKELFEIKKRLKPNGILFIAVPGVLNLKKNYFSDLNRYFQNAHTYNFSLLTLNNILTKSGFSLIKGNENIEALFINKPIKGKSKTNDFDRILSKMKIYESEKKQLSFKIIKKKITEFIYIMGLYKITLKIYKILKNRLN